MVEHRMRYPAGGMRLTMLNWTTGTSAARHATMPESSRNYWSTSGG
jgi:hypothetical protein